MTRLNSGDFIRARYQIVKKLGRGGWSDTYLAKDTQLPHRDYIVIKEITPSTAISFEDNRKRFQDEANALQTLGSHPQIPRLFDHFEENKKFYLVQEYIEGRDLHQELTSEHKRFTQQEVIDFLSDILEVLRFVHRHKKIHRDLKPSNLIRRAKDGKIVLIDFGAVKEIYSLEYTETYQVRSTITIGTPGYMPAEQGFGNPRYNSDIYALGIIAIGAITGLNPPTSPNNNAMHYDSMQINERTSEVVWQNLPNVTTLINIDRQLEAILNKMVRYNFSDRYQNADEIIADLQRINLRPNLCRSSSSSHLSIPKILVIGLSGFFGFCAGALSMAIFPQLFSPNTKDYQINFTEVCQFLTEEGKEFAGYQGTAEHTTFKSTPVWTVFGWKCIFSSQGDEQIRGINLNEYCLEKYKETGYQYEAFFKNYLDKDSWYCTNVGTKFENKKS